MPAGDTNVSVDLSNIPTDSTGKYTGVEIYRTANQSTPGASTNYNLDASLTNAQATAGYTDTTDDTTLQTAAQFTSSTISGNYSYYVTYIKAGLPESEPSPLIGPLNVTNDQVVLSGLPTPTGQYAGGQVRIYRNTAADPSSFFAVATVNSGTSYVDNTSDATITNTASPGFEQLDFNGPPVTTNTLLTDVQEYNGTSYVKPFTVGTLSYTGNVGGTTLSTASLKVTSTTTVQDLVNFLSQSSGIQPASADPSNPIPGDVSGAAQGGLVLGDGQIQIVSNNGTANAVSIPLTAFQMTPAGGTAPTSPNLNFTTTQAAVGQSVSTNFVAYDLCLFGIPVNVTVTMGAAEREWQQHDVPLVRQFSRQRADQRQQHRRRHGARDVRWQWQRRVGDQRYRVDAAHQRRFAIAGIQPQFQSSVGPLDHDAVTFGDQPGWLRSGHIVELQHRVRRNDPRGV